MDMSRNQHSRRMKLSICSGASDLKGILTQEAVHSTDLSCGPSATSVGSLYLPCGFTVHASWAHCACLVGSLQASHRVSVPRFPCLQLESALPYVGVNISSCFMPRGCLKLVNLLQALAQI